VLYLKQADDSYVEYIMFKGEWKKKIADELRQVTLDGETNVRHIYGGFQNISLAIVCTPQDEWKWITNVTNDLWVIEELNGVKFDDDVITFDLKGDYAGMLSLSFSGTAGKDFEFRLFNITKSTAYYQIGASSTGAGNYTNMTLPLYLEAETGNQYRFEIRCTSVTGGTATLHSAIFRIYYLHG